MQDETVIGLPTTNPSYLETTSCLVRPAYIGLQRVNVLQTPPQVPESAYAKQRGLKASRWWQDGGNPQMFQEMIQQQYELDRKEKMERIDCEVNSRVELNYSKKVTEDLKVLQISTDGMNPIDAAIINAQKD
ncbi:hypothetical protein Tco_1304464 [Tanacetum coccineum]